MFSVLDLILSAIFIIMALRGLRRGLIRSVLGVGRLVLAVMLTVALTSPVARWLDDALINPPVYNSVHTRLTAMSEKLGGGADELYNAIPENLRAHLGGAATDVGESLSETVEAWSETISRAISGAVASLAATVLIFVLSLFLLTMLMKLLSGLIKVSPLAGVNRLLGLLPGALAGAAIVALVSRVLSPLLVAVGRPEWAEASLVLRLFG